MTHPLLLENIHITVVSNLKKSRQIVDGKPFDKITNSVGSGSAHYNLTNNFILIVCHLFPSVKWVTVQPEKKFVPSNFQRTTLVIKLALSAWEMVIQADYSLGIRNRNQE